MKSLLVLILPLATLALSCGPAASTPVPASQPLRNDPTALQSLHVRIEVNPDNGSVTYFGWYDAHRNLLGPGGISAALVGMEPPELKGELRKVGGNELIFEGIDQQQIGWIKHYRIDDQSVSVTYRITNRRDQRFDAIIYSLADLPDALISGDNRDQYIQTPIGNARFHATIDDPHFPGEQMNPYALRSDSRRLEPGDSMEFQMVWRLEPARQP